MASSPRVIWREAGMTDRIHSLCSWFTNSVDVLCLFCSVLFLVLFVCLVCLCFCCCFVLFCFAGWFVYFRCLVCIGSCVGWLVCVFRGWFLYWFVGWVVICVYLCCSNVLFWFTRRNKWLPQYQLIEDKIDNGSVHGRRTLSGAYTAWNLYLYTYTSSSKYITSSDCKWLESFFFNQKFQLIAINFLPPKTIARANNKLRTAGSSLWHRVLMAEILLWLGH